MRILVDFTQIPVERTGVGIYAENLVRQLVPILGSDDLLFLVVQDDELSVQQGLQDEPKVRLLSIPSRIFRHRTILMLYEQCVLPFLLLAKRIDVVHSLHYTHPIISPAARVVTIHDLTFFLWPQMHTRGRRLIMPFFIRRALRNAEATIFVSNSARDDAERLIPKQRTIRRVVPLGVDQAFTESLPDLEIEKSLLRLGVSEPYLLFLGTIEPRKNLLLLLQAFEGIAAEHPHCTLVLAGKLGWDYEPVQHALAASHFRDRIRDLGYVSALDKRALLAHCKALIYPSLYEGFGLPILEGMAAGAPVITSNVSSLPEVAGDAAILIDPSSREALESAVRALLSNEGLAAQFRAAGYEQVKKFTWRRTAEETHFVYTLAVHLKR